LKPPGGAVTIFAVTPQPANYIIVPLILLTLVTQLRHVKTKQDDYHADCIACFVAHIDVDEHYHLSCASSVSRIRQSELPQSSEY